MWSIVTRLKRWFADMRRRYFGRFGSGTAIAPSPPPPPPPPPGAAALIFNVATNSQYVPIVAF